MSTFILTWNPARWNWPELAEVALQTAAGTPYECRWSTGNSKRLVRGDRVFLLKQGDEPKGILAAGRVTCEKVYDAPHYDPERAAEGDTAPRADIRFERILDPEAEVLFPVSDIMTGPLASVAWNVQSSGMEIPDAAAKHLEDLWQEHLQDRPEPGQSKKPRNPPWQRDELILALDLYVRHGGKHLAETHPEVVELSEVLNGLSIHPGRVSGGTFRNPNGVSMKLLNFRRFDSTQQGIGLTRGNRLEKEVWDEFVGQPERLHGIADGIKAGNKVVGKNDLEEPEEEAFPEGRILFRLHRLRERNKGVIEKAKDIEKKKAGKLCCCVCTFDFAAVYGKLGEDFIEGHHTKPLGGLKEETETKVSEISLVCSNCHRMLHRRRPWPVSVEELKAILHKSP